MINENPVGIYNSDRVILIFRYYDMFFGYVYF